MEAFGIATLRFGERRIDKDFDEITCAEQSACRRALRAVR